MLKVGLIVNHKTTSRYIYNLVGWGQNHKDVSIKHIVILRDPDSEKSIFRRVLRYAGKHGSLNLLNLITWKTLLKIDAITIKSRKSCRAHYLKFDLSRFFLEELEIEPAISKSGSISRCKPADIEAIKNLGLDVLLNCNGKILKGDILSAAKFGVLSFHYADNSIRRGGPPCFWEVYNKECSTGFVIQKLNEELDGGKVLLKGSIPTGFSLSLTAAVLYKMSYVFLKKLLAQISENKALPDALIERPYFNRLYRRPSFFIQLRYVLRLAGTIFVKLLRKFVFKKSFRWGVAFMQCSDFRRAVMWRATKIPNPPGRFLADPFVIKRGERVCCFLEDFDYRTRKGCISAYELSGNRHVRLGEVINEPFHMSFPYLFEFEGNLFMCPETSKNRDIRVYRCVEFPNKWHFVMSIMKDVIAVDSMIFCKDKTWWLMTNIDSAGTGEVFSELHVFSAATPLTQEWDPHSKNPVLFDSKVARNGGLLRDGDNFYRVHQSQGFDMYGKSSGIKRIASLSKNDYLEEDFAAIRPGFFSGIDGTHHFHHNDGFVVFDFVRLETIR